MLAGHCVMAAFASSLLKLHQQTGPAPLMLDLVTLAALTVAVGAVVLALTSTQAATPAFAVVGSRFAGVDDDEKTCTCANPANTSKWPLLQLGLAETFPRRSAHEGKSSREAVALGAASPSSPKDAKNNKEN